MQFATDGAVADHAHRLIVEHECRCIARRQVGFLAPPHQSIAQRNLPRPINRQTQRELRHLPRESRRRAQHPDALPITGRVIEFKREGARYRDDRLQPFRPLQHVAITPIRADHKVGLGQRFQEVFKRHGLVSSPDDIGKLIQASAIGGGKDLIHAPKARVDDDPAFHTLPPNSVRYSRLGMHSQVHPKLSDKNWATHRVAPTNSRASAGDLIGRPRAN